MALFMGLINSLWSEKDSFRQTAKPATSSLSFTSSSSRLIGINEINELDELSDTDLEMDELSELSDTNLELDELSDTEDGIGLAAG
ncbi:hypothetical protein F2Q69_00030398 [Brassica cretica]|uniref:Uncharacterized protein n=1 Tax=Brassica cretica TaxID=69181 RepID=A0A8S9RXS5_BRACR|nr:hypothetical protein F2Q69_00030398 [Brassica cretica]